MWVIEHFGPAQCNACQSALVEHEVLERRQIFELPELPAQVIEHRRMRSTCSCRAVHGGVFPADITAPVQYGTRLKAVCVNLNQQHFVPLARTSEFLFGTFGVAVSETSVLAFTHEALAQWTRKSLCSSAQVLSDGLGLYGRSRPRAHHHRRQGCQCQT